VVEVDFDICTFANASHSGDESDGGVGLNHSLLLCCVRNLNTDRSRIVQVSLSSQDSYLIYPHLF